MAKTERLLPADAAKARLTSESGANSMITPAVVDERTPEERAADEPNAVEIDEADLDAADAQESATTMRSADPNANRVEFDLSEGKPSEDPEIVAKRKEAFARAEAFERSREESRKRKAEMLAGVASPVNIPAAHIGGDNEIPEIFYRYATAFPHTTPDEHIICGFASIKLTVGDFRRLVGLPTRT